MPLVFVTVAVVAGGCGTDSGTKMARSADPAQETEILSVVEPDKDPDRIVCRRHKPSSSRYTEKICMTARQWHRAGEDSARTLDRAQRATGGLEGD